MLENSGVPSRHQCLKVCTVKFMLTQSHCFFCPGKIPTKQLQEEVGECNTKFCQLSLKLEKQDDDILYLREELKRLLAELSMTRIALKEIVDKL